MVQRHDGTTPYRKRLGVRSSRCMASRKPPPGGSSRENWPRSYRLHFEHKLILFSRNGEARSLQEKFAQNPFLRHPIPKQRSKKDKGTETFSMFPKKGHGNYRMRLIGGKHRQGHGSLENVYDTAKYSGTETTSGTTTLTSCSTDTTTYDPISSASIASPSISRMTTLSTIISPP